MTADDGARRRESVNRDRQALLEALYRERFGLSAHAPRIAPSQDGVEAPTLPSTGGGEPGP